MKQKMMVVAIVLALGIGLAAASTQGRWLHIRVEEHGGGGERVAVNIPLSVVEALIPAIENEEFRHGKVDFDTGEIEGIDLYQVLQALRDAPDADYVTVQSDDEQVRVSKEGGTILVRVDEEGGDRVRVQLPMEIVDAMLSGDRDELDIAAALHALADFEGDLVTIESDDESIRIWVDSNDRGE